MNLLNSVSFFLTDPVVVGGQGGETAAQAADGAAEAVTQAAAGFGGIGGIGGMLIYIAGLIALFYFFAIRPQKKREKELTTMQSSIKVGDWVMTSSGFYGKVVDISDQVFVVEFGTNKGVRIPIRKTEIIGNKEPNLSNTPVAEDNSKK